MPVIVQIPSLILPTVWRFGTETENIDDLVEHTSLEFPTQYLRDKTVYVYAVEVVLAGVPGPLNVWVEVSPYPSTVSAAYWSAIGGGGGALPPVAPIVEIAAGVNLTVHTFTIPWNIHSDYARVVVQTPVAAALPAAFWVVQVLVAGQST